MTVPLAPKLHCVSNKTAVKIQWELPEDNEYDATSYNISYQKQGNRVWKSFVVPGNVTEFFFTDLGE